MTKQDLEALITAARSDKGLLRKSVFNFDQVLKEKGFNLTDNEITQARKELDNLYRDTLAHAQLNETSLEPNVLLGKETQGRVIEMTLKLLQNAVEDARVAFRNLRLLSNITFAVGLSLFVLSAVSGLALQRETFSLIFGGLGIFMIVSVFIMKPKEEIQTALSNLLQAETVFLTFYDQLHFWAPFASNGSMEERKQASKALEEAAASALEHYQRYIEPLQETNETRRSTHEGSN